ncbi:hypothetical protein VTO42DRAFT_5738 [Malbranchea cinnamomea]
MSADEKGVDAIHIDSSSTSQKDLDGVRSMTPEERQVAEAAAKYGYGPLAQRNGALPAFGGSFHTPNYPPPPQPRKFANPAPLGLSAFALTTFVLSLINMEARGITTPNLVLASAFGYGGLVQLLAGMWEMAVGNTFGATALSSYGGFWISYAIIYTPGFGIITSTTASETKTGLNAVVGFWLIGWWIFTTIMLILTLKTSVIFFLLFFTLDLAFLFLAIGHFIQQDPGVNHKGLIKTGGFFGLLAAFLAWYTALAGIAENSNSFIKFPLFPFPWGSQAPKRKTERETV